MVIPLRNVIAALSASLFAATNFKEITMVKTFGFDKYTFFWNGPHSQWCESFISIDGQIYNCCEQYMMHKKALVFGDTEIAAAVMAAPMPNDQKKLGRLVKGFNPDIWNAVARDIVFRGNIAKYQQNSELRSILERTEGTLLVEASPFDKVWGIGMDVEAASVLSPDKWEGTNWLGQCITEVRLAIHGS
jgi:ribA/ribD-fused uncharacterized protein